MRVERDNAVIEYENMNIHIVLPENKEITERQLNNYLQFVLIDLGIDRRHLEPLSDETPEPVQVEVAPLPTFVNPEPDPNRKK